MLVNFGYSFSIFSEIVRTMQCHAQCTGCKVSYCAYICTSLPFCPASWLAGAHFWPARAPPTLPLFTLSVARLGRYGGSVPPAAIAVARQPSLVVRGQCAAGAHPAAAETPLCFSSLVSPDFEQRIFFVK